MENTDVTGTKRQIAQGKIYDDIRVMLSEKNIKGSEELIELVPTADRNAEWHFLKGCILTQNGWFYDARKHFEAAHTLEPENEEYTDAVRSLTDSANGYTDTWSKEQESEDNKTESKKRLEKGVICSICTEGCCECFCEGICEGVGNCL